jgi:AhpD family alkylhydroperoxidase
MIRKSGWLRRSKLHVILQIIKGEKAASHHLAETVAPGKNNKEWARIEQRPGNPDNGCLVAFEALITRNIIINFDMENRLNVFAKGMKTLKPLFDMSTHLKDSPIGLELITLVDIRVSQINKCAYCLDMHWKEAREQGQTEQRLYGLSAWEEAPYYTDRERAALKFAEAVTAAKVPDEVYKQVSSYFNDVELIDLTHAITLINTWNRINLSFPSLAGSYKVGMFG